MKLIQLNLWQGRLIRQATEFLLREAPDFICLQEVYSSGERSREYDYLHSFERLQATFPGYASFFSPTYEIPQLGERHGNALFSRFPLHDTETIFINGSQHKYVANGDYVPNTRNLQRAMVTLDTGQTFCLMNYHGYWDANPLGTEVSVEKMQQVARIIKESARPLVFGADCNLSPESPAMRPVHELVRDLTQEYNIPTTLNALSRASNVACDYVCVSSDVNVHSFSTSEVVISDHTPLIMNFTV